LERFGEVKGALKGEKSSKEKSRRIKVKRKQKTRSKNEMLEYCK
jgi:hypothetical protein